MSQVKKNFAYNFLYQVLLLILPLITVPYISRKLGTDGVGIYSYTYSIVYYFMLIAMLGINNYGNRTIAKIRDDKELRSKTFFEIYSLQFLMTIIMIICYLIYILAFNNKYLSIAVIQMIYLVSVMFDLNWFFFGLEKFKITVTRSTILKLLSLFLIFAFVKTKNDIWIYTLIMSCSTLFSQLLLIPFLIKEVNIVKISFNDIKTHIKPCLILFIPVIAIGLYKAMDKIMLGSISTMTEVGYYEQAEKIINLPSSLIAALGTVMLPHISNLVANGKNKEVLTYIKKSINFMMLLAFPICFGLVAISSDFVPLFLGKSFAKSSVLIYYLSSTVIFLSFANVIRTQYLIPKEKDKIYIVSVIGGAVVNMIINLILIPRYASIGACVGTILAEFFVMMYQVIAVRKELPILEYLKTTLEYLVKGLIMFIICYSIKYLNLSSIYTLITQILIGIVIYALLNIKYIKEIIPLKKKVIS